VFSGGTAAGTRTAFLGPSSGGGKPFKVREGAAGSETGGELLFACEKPRPLTRGGLLKKKTCFP